MRTWAVPPMTILALIATATFAGTLLGFSVAQRSDYADRDLPGLVDVTTTTPLDLDRPWWLPTRRFVARHPDDSRRRLDAVLGDMRETARRRGPA
jgi:hypothetical protein